MLETFFEDKEKITSILSEIEGQISTILNNKNGNHVIQKCFDVIHHQKLDFIIDNAIKYGGSSRKVWLSVGDEGDGELLIVVRDEGVGIPRNQLKKIFRRSHRAKVPGGRTVPGTGLGLYVVRFLVRRLGGTVEASSDGENQGAVFRVQLPLNEGLAAK